MKLLAFDIEIAEQIPEGESDWLKYRPLGIAVAATMAEGEVPKLWYGQGRPNGDPWPRMQHQQAACLVGYLERMGQAGYSICTWNGLRFDFDVLAEESGLHSECVALALGHVDVMFHFFAENGYAISLDAAAKGIGQQKTEGMHGALAPVLWAEGRYQEVMRYVAHDVRLTYAVTQTANHRGYLDYILKSGRPGRWEISTGGVVPCRGALGLPLPTPPRWIKDPWQREEFTAWFGREEVRNAED